MTTRELSKPALWSVPVLLAIYVFLAAQAPVPEFSYRVRQLLGGWRNCPPATIENAYYATAYSRCGFAIFSRPPLVTCANKSVA